MSVSSRAELSPLTRVFVVAPGLAFAQSLGEAIARETDLDWSGAAANVDDAVKGCTDRTPDVVLVDVSAWGMGALTRINDSCPGARVVVLADEINVEMLGAAAAAGAAGFLGSETSLVDVLRAIRAARNDAALIDFEALSSLLHRMRADPDAERGGEARARLTPREVEVLVAMSRGMDARAIATAHSISLHTVRGHVKSILRKLGVHSQLEAVAVAANQRILPGPSPQL